MSSTSPCDAFRDDLPELALGVLSGRQRSEVLAHVSECAPCAAELRQLSTVGDALLQLTPRVDPPLGFESRLAERLQRATTPRRARPWRTAAASAAAAVLVAFGVGVGAFIANRDHRPSAPSAARLINADLTSSGRVLGQVVLSSGPPAWMFVAVNGAASGTVRCDVTLAGGQVETVGMFQIAGEYGAWGARLTSPAADVRSARLIDSSGSVVAAAQFGT